MRLSGVPEPDPRDRHLALGLWLLDNCDLAPLAEACARLGRAEFMLTVSPLRLAGATGSPVNPIALL